MKKCLLTVIISSLAAFIASSSPVCSMLAANETDGIHDDTIPLPDGVVAVEYIKPTGTQWIDLPTMGVPNVSYYGISGILVVEKAFNMRILFDTEVDRQFKAQGYKTQYADSIPYYMLASNVGVAVKDGGISFDFNIITPFVLSTEGVTLKGIFRTVRRPLTKTFSTLRLFNSIEGTAGAQDIRVMSLTVMVGNRIEYDLIPVRVESKESSEGALFDYISGQLFFNQGTGSFIIGPDL